MHGSAEGTATPKQPKIQSRKLTLAPPMSTPPPRDDGPPPPRGGRSPNDAPPPPQGGLDTTPDKPFTGAYSAEFMASHAMHTIQISRILNAQHPLKRVTEARSCTTSAAPRLYVMVLYCSPCGEGPWTTASTGSFVERT